MPSGPRHGARPLTLIDGSAAQDEAAPNRKPAAARPSAADLDWSLLMASAQRGDREAYRRLLDEITPYLRALAAPCHRDPQDIEDVVQDTLLTLHAIRHTYDPTRPFGPWLVVIAHRRSVDRLRRQRRLRLREAPLTPEHETFPAAQANIDAELSDRWALHEAIDTLPAGQRRAIRLLKLEEMSLNQAAAASGMSMTALKLATHRAIKNLRRKLSGRSDAR